MVEVSRAITKHHYLVQDAKDIARIVKEAFHLASTGRPGPGADRHSQGRSEHRGLQPGLRRRRWTCPAIGCRRPPSPGRSSEVLAAIAASSQADHLLRRRGGRLGRGRGAARVRRQDRHPRRHDRARPGVDPQRPLPLAQHAGDARHRLRELRGQRGRPAAGPGCPVRRPRHRQAQRVRQARPDRPRRHRRLRDQQEQVRPYSRFTPTSKPS